VIRTVAGTGVLGYSGDGGPATEAQLNDPRAAVGPDGSIYISDSGNHRIRRIGPDGIINTVAGTGVAGYSGDGGPATEAQLNNPRVTLGPDGSLNIADSGNHRIRRIGSDGIITTVAGTGVAGYSGDNGPATQAQLRNPQRVAGAPDGSLYISDRGNHRIRHVGSDGIITTVAGTGVAGYSGDNGPAAQAQLNNPIAAVGPEGFLYISDRGNHRIRQVGPDGIITTVAGTGVAGYSGDGGPATEAQFTDPIATQITSDRSIYIADRGNHRIRRVAPDGIITTVAGTGVAGYSGDNGPATQAQIDSPIAGAVGRDGSLYISDSVNNRIRRVASIFPGFAVGDFIIAAEDGGEVYVFDASGRHLRTLNALTGTVVYQFAYDSAGRLLTITDGDGNVTTIERDVEGKPTAVVGPYGQRTTLIVNANGHLEHITNPANEAFGFTYTDDGLLTSITDPRNYTSNYQYDDLGYLLRTDDPAGGFQTLTRTTFTNGYEVARTTALGRTTNYRVERLTTGGQRLVNTFPDGTMTEAIMGTDGSQTITYSDGTVVTMQYGPDPRFGMQSPVTTHTTMSTPSGLTSVTQNTRAATLSDPNDPLSLMLLTGTTDVNGQVYTSSFDNAARTMTLMTPEGRETIATIDEKGRLTSVQRTGIAPSSYSYDSRGRISTLTQGTGANSRTYSLQYDSAPTDDGLLDRITDPESSTLSFRQYDAAGRPLVTELPDSNQVSFGYDHRGNLTSLTPPGRPAHTFTHTPLNLMQEYIPPDVGAGLNKTFYEYNTDRQFEKATRPDGKTVEPVYDPVTGRIERISILEGTAELGAVSFTYYPAGQPSARKLASITAVDGGIVQFTYDGSLLTGATWTGTVSGSVGYGYNNNFQVTSETVSGSDPISLSYGQDGLLKQAGELVLHRDDPARPETRNGLLRGTTLSNVTTTIDYNEFGELKDYSNSFNGPTGPVTLFESHYPVRDKLGRIKEKTETVLGVTKAYSYEYDPRGGLWKVFENGTLARQYEYDSNGNRLLFKDDGSPDTDYDNQDRLLRYGNTTYTYTDNGELKTKTDVSGQTTYIYDVFGNLTHVDLPEGTPVDYVIDGENRRIGKKVNGALVRGFLYRGKLKLLAELNAAGNVVSRFIYGTKRSMPEYINKGERTYRIISDLLGSPRLVVDAVDGTIVQSLGYDEFGNVLYDTNPGFQPFGFAGGIYDPDTGLLRFGFRDYDPRTGRWVTKDPILFRGGELNLYRYVFNDSINLKDSMGLQLSYHEACMFLGISPPRGEEERKKWVAELEDATYEAAKAAEKAHSEEWAPGTWSKQDEWEAILRLAQFTNQAKEVTPEMAKGFVEMVYGKLQERAQLRELFVAEFGEEEARKIYGKPTLPVSSACYQVGELEFCFQF
jgi:RHS repeat-associated protein